MGIQNIIAGSQMKMEYLRPNQNYLPNKIPVACSIFNNNYNTQYTLLPTVQITANNINAYLMCSGDAIIGQCDQETCTSLYDQAYFDQLAADSELTIGQNIKNR